MFARKKVDPFISAARISGLNGITSQSIQDVAFLHHVCAQGAAVATIFRA